MWSIRRTIGCSATTGEFTSLSSFSGTTLQTANLVFDQGSAGNDFVSDTCNLGAGQTAPSSDTLCKPMVVALDPQNNVYMADFNNNRVLEDDTPRSGAGSPGSPGSPGDVIADLVIGQGATGGTTESTTSICGA